MLTRPDPFANPETATRMQRYSPSEFYKRPAFRVSLTNLATGDTLEGQFVPNEVDEEVGPEYNNLKIPGLSHQPQQFSGTTNLTYSMELYFSVETGEDRALLVYARNFLQALCYARGSEAVLDGAPARVLFVWPNFASLTCILTKLQIKHSRFHREGHSMQYVASITLEEVRDVRLLPDDVVRTGPFRGPGSTTSPTR